jgi:hypothetical protein
MHVTANSPRERCQKRTFWTFGRIFGWMANIYKFDTRSDPICQIAFPSLWEIAGVWSATPNRCFGKKCIKVWFREIHPDMWLHVAFGFGWVRSHDPHGWTRFTMGTNNVRFIYLSVLIGGGWGETLFEHGIIIGISSRIMTRKLWSFWTKLWDRA